MDNSVLKALAIAYFVGSTFLVLLFLAIEPMAGLGMFFLVAVADAVFLGVWLLVRAAHQPTVVVAPPSPPVQAPSRICLNCGVAVGLQDHFCNHCGHSLVPAGDGRATAAKV
jgi:hypothetical protein